MLLLTNMKKNVPKEPIKLGALHRELQGAAHLARRATGRIIARVGLLRAADHQLAHAAGLRRPRLLSDRGRQGLLRAAGHAEARGRRSDSPEPDQPWAAAHLGVVLTPRHGAPLAQTTRHGDKAMNPDKSLPKSALHLASAIVLAAVAGTSRAEMSSEDLAKMRTEPRSQPHQRAPPEQHQFRLRTGGWDPEHPQRPACHPGDPEQRLEPHHPHRAPVDLAAAA